MFATRKAFVCVLSLLFLGPFYHVSAQNPVKHGKPSPAKSSNGPVPLHFEENRGQTDPRVQYIARGLGYTAFLTPSETVLALRSGRPPAAAYSKKKAGSLTRPDRNSRETISVLRMKLAGANASPVALPTDKLPGTVNYLLGRDSRKWRTGIPTYGKVQYLDVYSGIDLVYHSSQNQLEYDFVVNPGADPKKIAFSFEGASAVAMAASGDMTLDSPSGKLTAHKPQIYQLQNGQRKQVPGNFVMHDAHTVGVDVKDYDRTQPLVIDPVLTFATYLGGSSDDVATSIAADSQGYSYSTGTTASVDFPVVGTSLSAAPTANTVGFVSKLDPTGSTLIYSTYLGGTTYDSPNGIAVDANGQAYISGQTSSADFPVMSNAYQTTYGPGATFNAFLAKLSPDGQSLLYSTFLGGSVNDEGTQVAIDANQNAFVTGYASSPTFPVTAANAFQPSLNSVNGNAFVTRIDTTKSGASSLIYSTFLGGSSPYSFNNLNSGNFGGDGALGIAVDTNENAYVVGQASSVDFPITRANAYQTTGNANNSVFLTRLDTNQSGANSLVYSTFLGGTGTSGDLGFAIALDSSANAYITGCALSSDFPVSIAGTNSAAGKAFVAKFNTNLSGSSSLNYSTFLGGSSGECALALAVDPDGDAYVGGFTYSSDFPVTANAIQSSFQGNGKAGGFIATLSPDGATLLYGTYIGGNAPSLTSANAVVGLTLDSHEDLYIAGGTSSTDFATTPGALQTAASGTSDGFVAQISGIISTPQISSVSPQSGGIGATVTLIGSAFGNTQGQSTVSFNGLPATITAWSPGTITARVPSGLSPGTATVIVNGNPASSNGVQFTVVTPTLVSIAVTPTSPSIIRGSSQQFIATGTFSDGSTQNISASVNWNSAAPQVATINAFGLASGQASGTTTILASANGIMSSTALSVTSSAPSITSVSPASGVPGTQVTITGANFGVTQGASTVTFNGTTATPTSWSDTSIVATVPNGATTGGLVATVAGVPSNASSFTVMTLVSLAIAPQNPTVSLGNVQQFTATGTYSDGSTQDLSAAATWSTSLSGVATISSAGLAKAVGLGQATIQAAIGAINGSATLTVNEGFVLTGSLNTGRGTHTATLLNNGKVLVTGGFNSSHHAASNAELYDPATGTFAATGSLNIGRVYHAAALLNNGMVLVAGGQDESGNALTSAELYDPSTGSFTVTGNLNVARQMETLTPLNNAKVLVAGGADSNSIPLSSAEVYNPATGIFKSTGSLNVARAAQTAILLSDGTVLVAGGGGQDSLGNFQVLSSAELYDPAGVFTAVGPLNTSRNHHTATLLNNGMVLVAGGVDSGNNALSSAELYDPVLQTFTATGSLNSARSAHTATLLTNGTVLIAGGTGGNANAQFSAERYDSAAGTFTSTGSLNTARDTHTATLLSNGTVLVSGGYDSSNNALASAELFEPSTLPAFGLVSIAVNPASPSVAPGTVLYFTAIGTFSDGSTHILSSILWSSSDNTVVSVTNDSANRGAAVALATGPATVSACTGSLCGSTTMTVALPGPPPQPNVTSLSPTFGPLGVSVAISGTNFGASQGQSTVSFNGALATATSWSDTGIVAVVPAGATTGPVAVTVGGLAASGVNFVVSAPPSITSVSPNSGAAGTQVAISGAGFGSAQGSGTVLLGSRPGTVVSWSDTQIVAVVSNGSASGQAQVRQNRTVSNSVSFIVNTATITGVTPTTAAAGTQVTITGSGFGSAQGTGQVLLGTTPGAVNSWSDTQVVAMVAPGANSGSVQILQNGVWSNPVGLSVSGASPRISSITPNTGGAGTVVTIQGTGFGASQGSGIALIGAANASVNTWSDTQVSATVDANAVSGIVKIQQNGTWSNAVTFTVPSADSVNLNPNLINMLVGETRPITALNTVGQPVRGLTWTSSDTTIATLSTDDPPIITAVALGNVTITAGSASADVTVLPGTTLPVGTVLWSNPGDGSGVANIMPVVPSASGVDVFAQQNDGSVQAITSDGAVAWTTPPGNFDFVLPDFQGGFVDFARDSTTIRRFDGVTGKPYPSYTSPYNPQYSGLAEPVVHTDGTIFTMEFACASDACGNALGTPDPTDGAWVVGVDPSTGTAKFKVPTDNSTSLLTAADSFCGTPGSSLVNTNSFPELPLIAGDGFLYTSYVTKDVIRNVKQAATQPFPLDAYQFFNQLQADVGNSNFGAAQGDVGALEQLTGLGLDGLLQALQAGDRNAAIQDVDSLVPLFRNLCDSSTTTVSKLHLMRVGPDGTSSDAIAGQWKSTDNTVYSPAPNDPYHSTRVVCGRGLGFSDRQSFITNADNGAVYSWVVEGDGGCTVSDNGVGVGNNVPLEYHLTATSGGAVVSDVIWNGAVVPSQFGVVVPVLQLEDGSFVGSAQDFFGQGTMVAFDASGSVKWTQPGYTPQMATSGGGIIADTATVCTSNGCIPGTAVIFDANGAATGQRSNLPTQSWNGNIYPLSLIQSIEYPPVNLAGASFWSEVGGNPSGNGTSVPHCPCLVQSPVNTASNIAPRYKEVDHWKRASNFAAQGLKLAKYSPRSFEFALSNVSSLNYSLRSFQLTGGSSKTYLQLVGDGGFPGGHYNVGDLFNLAAATDADRLTASGSNTVIPIRVSSVQDFNTGLTTNGIIDGGITYFGHGAQQEQADGTIISLLALSPNEGVNTNVSVLNVNTLSNAKLAPDVKITLRGCNAGLRTVTGPSIAQLIANQLGRQVYAWKVGMWFTSDLTRRFPSDKEKAPSAKPIYLIPLGGTGVQPCTFTPNQPEPKNCGGSK